PTTPSSTLFPYTTLFRSQALEVLARTERTPGHRLLAGVADQAGRRTLEHEPAQPALVAVALAVLELLAGEPAPHAPAAGARAARDRKSTRLNSSHVAISY